MRNYKHDGRILPKVAPSGGVTAGLAYLIGEDFGVAVSDAAVGEAFELAVDGVVEIVKNSADIFTDGAIVYWDDTAKECITPGPGDKVIGTSQGAPGAGILVMDVLLMPIAG